MLFRSSVVILIASSVLIAGCRAPQSGDKAASHRSAAPLRADDLSDSTSEFASDADLQSAINAHAHYGAGVIHELNLEPESALEDYYNAALLDPTNYSLVIDVAQQFLQAKQPDKALDLLRNS